MKMIEVRPLLAILQTGCSSIPGDPGNDLTKYLEDLPHSLGQ
jgi:hypothetical protein